MPCGRLAVLGYVAAVFLLADVIITVALLFHGGWLRQHAVRCDLLMSAAPVCGVLSYHARLGHGYIA